MYIYIPWGHGICDKFIYLQCTVAWVGECPCVNLIVHMAHAGQRERNWTIISHANHLVVSTKLSCLTWVLYILSQSILQKLSGNQLESQTWVHDQHALGRDARVGVHLLEHLVDVDRVGLGALLLALAAALLLWLRGLLQRFRWHTAETHAWWWLHFMSVGAYTQSSWQPNLIYSLWAYNKDSEVQLMSPHKIIPVPG